MNIRGLNTGLLLVAVVLASCSDGPGDRFYGSGVMEATEVMVSAETAGRLLDRQVDQGDSVTRGQVIAQQDTQIVMLEFEQAHAALEELQHTLNQTKEQVVQSQVHLENAEKRYQRLSALYRDNSATQQQLDDAETAYESARSRHQQARSALHALNSRQKRLNAQLDLARQRVRDTRIESPLDGVVLETYKERGEMVQPGGPVCSIADLSRMTITIYVSERNLARIKIGQEARIRLDTYPEQRFPARVVWISPRAEFTPGNIQTREARADLVYAVKVAADNPDGLYKIGMPAEVHLQGEHDDGGD
jgi:HlyD family secretion protein